MIKAESAEAIDDEFLEQNSKPYLRLRKLSANTRA